jgi:glycosyltransferase involved in cell wall biosynthesis
VFGVSEQVNRLLADKFQVPSERLFLLPPIAELSKMKGAKTGLVKEQLGIPAGAKVVLGCGMAEWRKGTDIFIRVARQVIRYLPDVHFVWLGVGDNVFSAELQAEKEGWDESGRLHLVPNKMDSKPYFEAMDVFFLSSREDPFPLVMLEAAFQGKPIVGFKGSGGVNDFLKEFPDLLVGYLEEEEAKESIINWLKKDTEVLNTLGEKLNNSAMNYSPERFMTRWNEMDI